LVGGWKIHVTNGSFGRTFVHHVWRELAPITRQRQSEITQVEQWLPMIACHSSFLETPNASWSGRIETALQRRRSDYWARPPSTPHQSALDRVE
jgi:hypothetical protein